MKNKYTKVKRFLFYLSSIDGQGVFGGKRNVTGVATGDIRRASVWRRPERLQLPNGNVALKRREQTTNFINFRHT